MKRPEPQQTLGLRVVGKKGLDAYVYSGFPAKIIKKKETVWDDLVIVSLNGGDWQFYKNVNRSKVKNV